MILRQTIASALIWLSAGFIYAQQHTSSEIYQDLLKFRSPYRVLYLAAHPDDENTRLISYFSNELKAETAYLSLTRGDGGQNLIGDEKGALLGVLRTQELLSARRIDGGSQYFTRAVDFGYSKTSNETFSLWGKDKILSDVCFVIRNFKPHIIVNRFPTDNYSGHGHHHASALLSNEAFDLTGKKEVYPEQVERSGTWQVGSLYHNNSTWWDQTLAERARNDFSISEINIGKYNELMGYSYNELAAYSRSEHKSQGFGSSPKNGNEFEYLEYLKGNFVPGEVLHKGLLDSIDLKWLELEPEIDKVIANFNFTQASKNAPALLQLRKRALELDSSYNRFSSKLQQIDEIIIACLGLEVELLSPNEGVTPDGSIKLDIRALNRTNIPVTLVSVDINDEVYSWNRSFKDNVPLEDTIHLQLKGVPYSNPYWLQKPFVNTFDHEQKELLSPENKGLGGSVKISIDNQEMRFFTPIKYKWTDRVKGGLQKKLEVLPRVGIQFDRSIYLPTDSTISGNVVLRSYSDVDIEGKVVIKSEKRKFKYDGHQLLKAGSVVSIPFSHALNGEENEKNELQAFFVVEDDTFDQQVIRIDYDHIEPQVVLLPAKAKLVPIRLKATSRKIAYVEGPDNEMIEQLNSWGLTIENFTEEDLLAGKLEKYDVLLFGIRSLNVDPSWNGHAEAIQDFMKNGGLVVMQYQTSRGINPIEISPYSFEVSRNRVTNENASANLIRPEHKVLNTPYKLTRSDFANWNQERGLYFGDNWEENFTTVISWHDEGELDHFGSLLIGDYGKGAFIYTGISFFRHIPYGVPGSYKLLQNILSYQP